MKANYENWVPKGKSAAIARSHSSSIAALRGILETHTA